LVIAPATNGWNKGPRIFGGMYDAETAHIAGMQGFRQQKDFHRKADGERAGTVSRCLLPGQYNPLNDKNHINFKECKMKKRLSIGVASALALVMLISATFAWFTAQDSVVNHLETAQITDGSVSIVEVFTPPKDWLPGQTVTKEIAVANNGSAPVLARISFEETMKLLNIPAKDSTTPYVAGSNVVPQLFDATQYLKDPWKNVPNDFTIDKLPDGAVIKMQQETAGGRTSYSFVILHKITADGKYKDQYQRMEADFEVTGKTIKLSNVKYYNFGEQKVTEALWANFAKPITNGTFVESPSASAIYYPMTDINKKIHLNYKDPAAFTADPLKDKSWWYNEADGYFYYIGKIEPGTRCEPLLESLTLDAGASSSYSGMEFDLIARMDAIQNTSDALTSSDGWKLNPNSKLYEALAKHCMSA
jgi:predicted ribosomally synthesized peptide with SipW-like signal peptide